jgi:hypothetical protein
MKTKIFFIAVFTAMLFTCQTLQAQITYGVHAAGNLETQATLGQLWNNVDLYQGFLIGGFVEYNAGNHLSFQTELNYQKKGAKLTTMLDGTESVERKEFNYLSVPLLIKGNIHDPGLSDKCDLTFFTGPYMGFLASVNSNVKTGKISTPINIDNQAEKTDWGIVFGGGVSFKLANGGAILAELRYEMGLAKVDKLDPDLRNKGMGITIGYRF